MYPKISVIVPVYNTDAYLRRCLDSVIGQTLKDIEVICINDGSSDSSPAILQEYAAADERVKVIDFSENRGASAARNAGIDAARGEYIGFVDSDDWVDLDFYEKLYNRAAKTFTDIVKGSIKEICEKTGNDITPELYKLNDKIRENKAYFYCTFTTAIYNVNLLKDNSILFPENIVHFEDPVFAIHSAIMCEKVIVVDDAYYFYMRREGSETKKQYSEETILSYTAAIKMIVDLLNQYEMDKTRYVIIYNFIFKMLLSWCYNIKCSDRMIQIAIEMLIIVLDACKYKEENWYYYFLDHKNREIERQEKENKENEEHEKEKQEKEKQKKILFLLRNKIKYGEKLPQQILKEYNNFNNSCSDGRPLLKILVGYIKRTEILFKNEILTPIHLGRAVAAQPCVSGPISTSDIDWLYGNMGGDDDFCGNISALNRRVGLLTGTYWAYKNYEKLGNPEYFGSFGYRRLFDPMFLEKIRKFDAVVPRKHTFSETLREQYIVSHGSKLFGCAMKKLEKLYPKQIEDIEQFFLGRQTYFYEIYVLRKPYFMEFCSWIFPILFALQKIPAEKLRFSQVEIESSIKHFEKIGSSKICNKENFELYQLRDLGFMLERLTGYFLHCLSKRSDLKFMECDVIILQQNNVGTT
jgi:glycosyltransferase involved in cell wall biosynthesis